jgi:hypothetical protein
MTIQQCEPASLPMCKYNKLLVEYPVRRNEYARLCSARLGAHKDSVKLRNPPVYPSAGAPKLPPRKSGHVRCLRTSLGLDQPLDNLDAIRVFQGLFERPIAEVDYPTARRLIPVLVEIFAVQVWEEDVTVPRIPVYQALSFIRIEHESHAERETADVALARVCG